MTDSDLPNFKRFTKYGTRAEYVQPIFPSMSYPSWTSIVTGLANFLANLNMVFNSTFDIQQASMPRAMEFWATAFWM